MYKFVTLDNSLPEAHPVPTFAEAWEQMATYVKARIAAGTFCLQLLETSIWIEVPGETPLFFYEAKDRAYNEGLME